MANIKIIPFAIDHVDLVNHKIEYPSLEELKSEIFIREDCGEKGITCLIDDKVIFCCGLKRINLGVGHVWVVPSVYCDTHKIFTYKTIKDLLEKHAKEFRLHRIQTTIEPKFVKWIEFLGFKKESILKQVKADKTDLFFYTKFYET
ncbi:hypothetical protein UFOVP1451_45 [uncultured Caudovirales phage]|uniref:Uncharacterized protein n=1 Tax=uncultured Caudovirales phage TaxID=2100421 RepID=A0A6J5SH66_9CAUD|nr:hypothetical protein UFOVP1451_45 [uncultured Caudovirales phage]